LFACVAEQTLPQRSNASTLAHAGARVRRDAHCGTHCAANRREPPRSEAPRKADGRRIPTE
jgi:hypothetical protein